MYYFHYLVFLKPVVINVFGTPIEEDDRLAWDIEELLCEWDVNTYIAQWLLYISEKIFDLLWIETPIDINEEKESFWLQEKLERNFWISSILIQVKYKRFVALILHEPYSEKNDVEFRKIWEEMREIVLECRASWDRLVEELADISKISLPHTSKK